MGDKLLFNFDANFHSYFIRKIAIAKVSKWSPDLKRLARKKSMRLKLIASSIVPGKTVVTPLIQHNNNNWPSPRTRSL